MMDTLENLAIIQNNVGIDGRSKTIAEAIRTLSDDDTNVDILTLANTKKFDRFVKHYDLIDYSIQHKKYLSNLPLPPGMTYRQLLLNRRITNHLKGYDLVFNSNNCVRFLPNEPPIINYIHEPLPAIPRIDTRYHDSLFLSVYALPLQTLHKITGSLNLDRHLVLTNSRFIYKQFKAVFDHFPDGVLYPPCVGLARDWEPTGTGIATLARFHPTKRQRMQLEVATQLPEIEFTIMGRVDSRTSRKYYQKCKSIVEKRGLNNVELIPDISNDDLSDVLRAHRFFLHSMYMEHFGISIVEGLQNGCVPIVHDSGGPREIVPISQLRYESVSECVAIITKYKDSIPVKFHEVLSNQLKKFTRDRFREKLRKDVKAKFNMDFRDIKDE